ncbi:lipopolysaccharide biosynthesis protein [Celeribacter sp. SCSIO 80788]|uniref:lipopolysaccharide biosynthesis protein n=1 Tax=Celeribacter sp. SCSIO 80788 TaxID=3117013 RepID=UPI003DA65B1B
MTEAPQGEARVSLRRLVGWGLIGQLSYVISQFLLLVALARYASVADVGRFGLVSAITLPIYWFFNLGIRANQATDTRGTFSFHEFLVLRIVASLVAYGIIVLLAFTVVDPLARTVMLVFGAAKGVETYSELCYGAFQRADRMSDVAISLILRGFGGTALFWIVIAQTGSTSAAYGGLLLAWVVVAAGFDLTRALRMAQGAGDHGTVRTKVVWKLAITSLPLAFNALLSALQGASPRYVIGHFLGLVALGHFTVVGYAMQAVTTIVNAIGQSIVARLAHYVSSGNRHAFRRTLRRFLQLVAVASAIASLAMLGFGNWVLVLIFGADYAGQGALLALVMIAAGTTASATILQSGLLATRRFGLNLRIRIVSFVALLIGSVIGALTLGLPGVVMGMIASAALQSGLLWETLRRLPFETGDPR